MTGCDFLPEKVKKLMNMSSKKKIKLRIKKNSILRKLIIVFILLIVVLNVLRYAGYYKRDDNSSLVVMIQNDSDVQMAHDVYFDENNVIYFSEDDMKNFFDKELYYEKDESNLRKYISISQSKILEITEEKNHMYVNGTFTKIRGSVINRDGVYYFPISELENVYNINIEYLKDKNRLNIDKLSEEKTVATVNRNIDLKYKKTNLSKTVKKLSQGDKVTIIDQSDSKWVKVKTDDYQVGYVKKTKLIDVNQERNNLELNNQEFADFDFNSDIVIEINDETYQDFNDKISTYQGRTDLTKDITSKLSEKITNSEEISSKNIGIKMNITEISDIENYYRFLKELKAYVNSNGGFLIVVNQPSYDKNILNDIANIIV